MKQGWHGPGLCPLCRLEGQNNDHLFLNCYRSQLIWQTLENSYGIQLKAHASIYDMILWCNVQKLTWRRIFILSLWNIWKWRNNIIFNGTKISSSEIIFNIVAAFEALPQKSINHKRVDSSDQSMERCPFPMAFFDDVEQQGTCGCGILIMINENTQFSIHWNGGRGSNSKAEAMALAGLLKFCLFLDLQHVSIFGDSKVMVDFISRKNQILVPHLIGWMGRINFFWGSMVGGSIYYICRDKNNQADSLSKLCLHAATGLWFLQIFSEGESYHIQEFNLPDF